MKFRFLKVALASTVLAFSCFANSAVVLLVDLTVENQVTISASSGLSLATVNDAAITGFSLMDILGSPVFTDTVLSGNLTSANQTSDSSPAFANFGGSLNVNVFGFSADGLMTFTEGALAFTGQAILSVNAATYSSLLAGQSSGDVLAPFDNFFANDESLASVIGTWERVAAQEVSAPSLFGIFTLALIGLAVRRFKQ